MMRTAKMQNHLKTKHSDSIRKSVEYFQTKLNNHMKQETNSKSFFVTDDSAKLASYELAYLVAKSKKPYSIAENLIMPAARKLVGNLFGKDALKRLQSVPYSNDTIERRINYISDYYELELVEKLKISRFAIQLDESTDCANENILMCCVRYFDSNDVVENILFCKKLTAGTSGKDIFDVLSSYLSDHDIPWINCVGICTDGARSISGKYSGLRALVQNLSPRCL